MSKLVAFFLYLFIFVASWSSVFRLHDWLPFYLVPLYAGVFLGLLHFLLGRGLKKIEFDGADIILFVFLAGLILNGIFNNNAKTGNYILAYFSVFFVQYLIPKYLFPTYLTLKKVLDINSLAVLTVTSFCIIEFAGIWLFGFDVQDFIMRSKQATATIASGSFGRSYGFSTEPTQVGFYLDTLAPLALWNISRWKLPKIGFGIRSHYLLYAIIAIGWLTPFSSAAFVVVVAVTALMFMTVWRMSVRHVVKFAVIMTAVIAPITIFNAKVTTEIVPIFFDILEKVTLSTERTSVSQRLDSLNLAVERIQDNPILGIGMGQAAVMGESSSINWYVFLFMEVGIPLGMLMVIFLMVNVFRMFADNGPMRVPFLFGAVAGCFHFVFLSAFFVPNLWLLFAIFWLYRWENQKRAAALGAQGLVVPPAYMRQP